MRKWVLPISIFFFLLQLSCFAQTNQTEPKPGEQKSEKGADSWVDRIKIKGDFRYRHEMIDEQDKDSRNRQRIRLRLGIDCKVNDDSDVIVQISTGGDDPVSTNQTLTGSFNKKAFSLDMAYFDWHPGFLTGIHVLGGKLKNPFYSPGKSELIWDSDLNPEGLAIKYNSDSKSAVEVFLSGADLWIEERKDDNDSMLVGAQAGLKVKFAENKASVSLGGSYFGYSNVKGFSPFYDPDKKSAFYGNSYDENKLYLFDYKEMELFADAVFPIGKIPLNIYGNYVKNSDPSTDNTGYLFGMQIGKCKDPGTFEIGYYYENLEKDAVVGAFCNSDFGGGGTNAKGHRLNANIQLAKNLQAGICYFINQKNLDDETDYNRLQLDVGYKF
jgi:hypothetical protein